MGDYASKTADLSLAEHGAYTVLLDICYSTEKPLPGSYDALYRLCRAMTKAEQDAVKAVADRFFPLGEDDLRRNPRAADEIAKAQATIEKQRKSGADSASKRWLTDGSEDGLTDRSTHRSTDAAAIQPPTSNLQPPNANPKENNVTALSTARPPTDPIPYEEIVAAYHAAMVNLPKVRELTTKRRTAIRTAWQASSDRRDIAFWKAYFEECAAEDFLNGAGPYRPPHENWRPTFDHLLKTDTVTRVFEKAMDRLEREAAA